MFEFLRNLARRPAHDALAGKSADWLIVGLGNPGAKYAATKHNVGFMALDMLIDATTFTPIPSIKGALAFGTEETVEHGEDGDGSASSTVAYLRPTTFMNLSGEAVAPVAAKLGVPPERIVVLHDELDLPPGKVRIKLGGNENGHNGLKSITEQLGTRDYVRVRIGIGRPPKGTPVPDWVLGPLPQDSAEEQNDVTAQLGLAAEAAEIVVKQGVQKAQNAIHSK